MALITDWQKEFELPADAIKGGLCMSGMYEMIRRCGCHGAAPT